VRSPAGAERQQREGRGGCVQSRPDRATPRRAHGPGRERHGPGRERVARRPLGRPEHGLAGHQTAAGRTRRRSRRLVRRRRDDGPGARPRPARPDAGQRNRRRALRGHPRAPRCRHRGARWPGRARGQQETPAQRVLQGHGRLDRRGPGGRPGRGPGAVAARTHRRRTSRSRRRHRGADHRRHPQARGSPHRRDGGGRGHADRTRRAAPDGQRQPRPARAPRRRRNNRQNRWRNSLTRAARAPRPAAGGNRAWRGAGGSR
jgi:hypothetical protein